MCGLRQLNRPSRCHACFRERCGATQSPLDRLTARLLRSCSRNRRRARRATRQSRHRARSPRGTRPGAALRHARHRPRFSRRRAGVCAVRQTERHYGRRAIRHAPRHRRRPQAPASLERRVHRARFSVRAALNVRPPSVERENRITDLPSSREGQMMLIADSDTATRGGCSAFDEASPALSLTRRGSENVDPPSVAD